MRFVEYLQTEIEILLIWEIGNLCDKYVRSRSNPFSREESHQIKRKLFEWIDPSDYRIRSRLGADGYYLTYYKEIYEGRLENELPQDIIVSDTYYYTYAPLDLQEFLWGNSLYASILFTPGNYCEAFKKYVSRFSNSEFIDFFEKMDLCKPIEEQKYKVLSDLDMDLFTTISFYFPNKRVFIDLWATWCAPCKIEFRSYDASFYEFMEKHKIELVYISIDKPDDRSVWEREISELNLKGTHVLAGDKLFNSIKEVIYDEQHIYIPRYLLVNEKGKLLSSDHVRPSDISFKNSIRNFFD